MGPERDLELRGAAVRRARQLSAHYDGLVPIQALRAGFACRGERISFGSFYSGIFRPRQCRDEAALCLVTAPPKERLDAPYPDEYDERRNRFRYHYRAASRSTPEARLAAARDNRALRAAFELGVPLIYFRGIGAGQYAPVAPIVVVTDDAGAGVVEFEAGLPVADVTAEGIVSSEAVRAYATREARYRLHQQQFRSSVLRAYAHRCTVCALREASLLQAAHIIEDRQSAGTASVINGLSLCAIHHLAYDRNLLGIDPRGVVHIAHRLLEEVDGPMLRVGLQGFHGQRIEQPRRRVDRPDPERLEVRFAQFRDAA